MSKGMVRLEDVHQKALIAWSELSRARFPELALLYHCPNEGKRSPAEGSRLKAMGVKKGVPDLFLPVARGLWHGLYIELKAGKGKLTAEQTEWIEALRQQGYAACVCVGWDEAKKKIEEYLLSH